MIYKELLHV